MTAILPMAQIWLLSATLESYLAGQREAAQAGASLSGVLFAVCLEVRSVSAAWSGT
jgi:hypothetical protein